MKKYLVFLIIFIVFISSGCSKIEGDLIIKGPEDDHYVYFGGRAEYEENSRYEWVYKLKSISQKEYVSVTYYKKEIIWVDVKTLNYNLTNTLHNVYGSFDDLVAGEYRLVIWDKTRKTSIKDIKFTIYKTEE